MAIKLNKGEEEKPASKFNLSKATPITESTKEHITENQTSKGESNKTMLFSILGVICLAAIIWFFVHKAKKSPDQQIPGTEQISANDKATPKSGSTADGNASTPENVSTTPDGSKATTQPKAIASQGDQAVKTGNSVSSKQPAQIQTEKAITADKKASKPSASVASDVAYQKNKAYRVYLFPFGDSNSSKINPELEKLANILKQNPVMKISISAYTDDIGDVEFNKSLSSLRAKSIHDYLISKGIDAMRMKYQGKGISTTYENKAENRRAEFELSE